MLSKDDVNAIRKAALKNLSGQLSNDAISNNISAFEDAIAKAITDAIKEYDQITHS